MENSEIIKIGSVEIALWAIPNITGSGPPAVDTERMVEVPIALWFISKYGPNIIEVGAVTPYYSSISHPVFDPFDSWPNCQKKSADEISYPGSNLLSISTIEHIHNGEYNQPNDPNFAIGILEKMMKSKNWLITWAAGYHHSLDNFVESSSIKKIMLLRTQHRKWELSSTIKNVAYNSKFPYGNALYVVSNCEEMYNT